MKKKRLAAIDIGTNSIRSIVVEADHDGTFRVLDDEKATVRLGDGLHRTGIISPDSRRRALEALARFCKINSGYGVVRTEAIATSAVRKAENGAAFIREVEEELGLTVSVVTGEEEAELAAQSAFNNFDLDGNRHLLADLGGGSLELVTTIGRHLEHVASLELGAVYLTETFLSGDPIKESSLKKLRRHIRGTLRLAFPGDRPVIHSVIGSGGTLTAMAAMIAASRGETYGSLHGSELLHADVVHLLAMLSRTTLAERRNLPGLNPDRADIIVAGVAVVEAMLDFFHGNLLKINERGIREGIILRALHVAGLAHQIFLAVAETYRLGEREQQLLEAATILHDIGYFINYTGHHKQSYHLIRHGEIFGFTPRERELIAQIARYHRKSLPRVKHLEYQRLCKADRLLVARLGGILRLADGMDRRRTSQVTGLDLIMEKSRLTVRLQGEGDLSVELFAAKAKGELFERAFRRRLVFEPLLQKSEPEQTP